LKEYLVVDRLLDLSEDLIRGFKSIKPYFVPVPRSGIYWVDFFYIIFLAFLQFNVTPFLLGGFASSLDLLTPWIVLVAVVHSYRTALGLAFLAAMMIEGHRSLPSGLYLCLYFMIVNALWLIREMLSWRNAYPWRICLMVACGWVVSFEGISLLVLSQNHVPTIGALFAGVIRILLMSLFGFLYVNWAVKVARGMEL
jgi:hypothetical protein